MTVACTGWISRLVMAAVQLISIPILLSYLGTEAYAVFAVLVSLEFWFALTEFGIGSTLQNVVSEGLGDGRDMTPELKASANILLWLFCTSALLITLTAPWLQDFLLRRFDETVQNQPFCLIVMVGIVFVIHRLTFVAYRVFYGQQRGYLTHIYQAISRLISLAGILLIVRFYQGEQKLKLLS